MSAIFLRINICTTIAGNMSSSLSLRVVQVGRVILENDSAQDPSASELSDSALLLSPNRILLRHDKQRDTMQAREPLSSPSSDLQMKERNKDFLSALAAGPPGSSSPSAQRSDTFPPSQHRSPTSHDEADDHDEDLHAADGLEEFHPDGEVDWKGERGIGLGFDTRPPHAFVCPSCFPLTQESRKVNSSLFIHHLAAHRSLRIRCLVRRRWVSLGRLSSTPSVRTSPERSFALSETGSLATLHSPSLAPSKTKIVSS